MGTRRPMNRTSPGNGRYDSLGSSNGSASESDENNSSYNPRADSRNYLLNVRPENRTTFCNIISQLTEETQPCFETTLKPRAVSEGSDAKFICMVSGYPEPEITWYKDDEEMDRYCGLPKYEIFRNGKKHTLQIYKCSEEDAAIYQASARNNKGIVSCSGVLEVGTMTEYKIHQRWFAKLKRKAEAKMREIEQSRRKVKENLEEGDRLRALSPERIQRKRRFSEERKEDKELSSVEKDNIIKVHIPDPSSRLQDEGANIQEQPLHIANGLQNFEKSQGEEATSNGYALPENIEENGKEFLAYIYETVDVITKKSTSKESYAKKKKKEEPPSIPKAEPKKEEVPQGNSPKKGDGISPAPRRSRFMKDTSKAVQEEKMEVQPPQVTSNRQFVTSTAPPKMGITVKGNGSKKKDNVASESRTGKSSSQAQSQFPPKEEVSFCLKDMYFEDSLPTPEEEKVPLAYERDKKAKTESQFPSVGKHIVSPSAMSVPQGQVKEIPKAAPRRSKEQRDVSAGRKSQISNSKTNDTVPGAKNIRDKQGKQEVKPVDVAQTPCVVDSVTESTKPTDSIIPPEVSEQNLKKGNLFEPVTSLLTDPTPIISQQDNFAMLDITEEKTQEDEAKTTSTASEDPLEGKSRTETLQKLQHLEVEYMALQKAYALLQEQLELVKQAEQQAKVHEPPDILEKNKSGNDTGDKVVGVCPSSPVPILMETDESIKEEVAHVFTSISQTEPEGDSKSPVCERSSSRALHSPVSLMEFSSEEGSHIKDNQIVEMEEVDLKDKSLLALDAVSKDTKEIEFKICQPDDTTIELKTSQSSVVKITSHEIEMMEEGKQEKHAVELKEEKTKDNKIHVESKPKEVGDTFVLVTDDNPLVVSKSLQHPNEVLSVPTQTADQEATISEAIVDHVHPGAEIQAQSDESVATLLRDVKKALESGITNDVDIPSDSSSSSALSPQVISTPEGYDEVESMLSSSREEDKSISQDHGQLEVETIDIKSSHLHPNTDLSTETPEVSSPPEILLDDIKLKEQGKQQHSLVTSLKNSLLILFHMKSADVIESSVDTTDRSGICVAESLSPEEVSSPEGSMSPPSSRKINKAVKDTVSVQTPESMHSSSTSGKLTPTSEEDMVQNDEPLQTSPILVRKTTEFSRKGVITQVESAPISPATPKRSTKAIPEAILLRKEDLRFSPSTSRKIAAKIGAVTSSLSVPSIVVGSLPVDKTPGNILDLYPENTRKWKSTENVSLIPSATPEELASGARRKIFLSKQRDDGEIGSTGSLTPPSKRESPSVSPGTSRRSISLLASQSPPIERRSPGMVRRMAMLEVPKIYEESVEKGNTVDEQSIQAKDACVSTKEDIQTVEPKKVNDPYKAPQVIRKIRAEQFSDASGNLKLWCQFFNILSDSAITWYKDEVEVAKVKRSSGDEGQVALAIVQASVKDCGVYQCTIQNEYGTDSTDCLLSSEILSGFITKEEVEVGEEIEMTPMVFAKGVADSGYWGDKFFGRLVMENAHVGEGFLRKACRVKVIYGLEPMFESGKTCIIKIRNLITFGTKNESTLVEKNYEITIQDCKIQNTTREYCKIFAAECRAVPNFGQLPEILPLNLIYRPANNIPYATIEEDLEGRFEKYCIRDITGKLHMKNTSEIEQKCCTFQHWVYQWTNGNFLVTILEGVGWKLTNIGIATKSKGYQGLKESCFPTVLDEFAVVHQCNSYCEMLSLKSLKVSEGLQLPSKPKGSKSPSIGRKAGSAQSSPQVQKKVMPSPQSARKGGVSPKAPRKATETGDNLSVNKGSNGSKFSKTQ
ncbi:alpha-protein kinase 3 isoform X2 [Bombina bombina]|uniref:alpha-protein kinase 3 isoform X2 n=1 Tax=Bombina bombina TaxID=8345 RepID=UPI00235AE413|nr:alpha-protein kinase 3 isoform X2 [Bombina bombina]